jgi:hypothetical protein
MYVILCPLTWSISIHACIALFSFGYPISFARFVFGVAEILGYGSIAFLQSVMICNRSLVC